MDIQGILITVASILFAGNIFFIRKLVEKVDANNTTSEKTGIILQNFEIQLSEIKSDIKYLKRIEIEVAVLKAKYEEK